VNKDESRSKHFNQIGDFENLNFGLDFGFGFNSGFDSHYYKLKISTGVHHKYI